MRYLWSLRFNLIFVLLHYFQWVYLWYFRFGSQILYILRSIVLNEIILPLQMIFSSPFSQFFLSFKRKGYSRKYSVCADSNVYPQSKKKTIPAGLECAFCLFYGARKLKQCLVVMLKPRGVCDVFPWKTNAIGFNN